MLLESVHVVAHQAAAEYEVILCHAQWLESMPPHWRPQKGEAGADQASECAKIFVPALGSVRLQTFRARVGDLERRVAGIKELSDHLRSNVLQYGV